MNYGLPTISFTWTRKDIFLQKCSEFPFLKWMNSLMLYVRIKKESRIKEESNLTYVISLEQYAVLILLGVILQS